MALVAVNQVRNFGLECFIAFIGEWSILIWVTFPHDLVPESVKLVNLTVVWKWERIGTLVAFNVLFVELVNTV